MLGFIFMWLIYNAHQVRLTKDQTDSSLLKCSCNTKQSFYHCPQLSKHKNYIELYSTDLSKSIQINTRQFTWRNITLIPITWGGLISRLTQSPKVTKQHEWGLTRNIKHEWSLYSQQSCEGSVTTIWLGVKSLLKPCEGCGQWNLMEQLMPQGVCNTWSLHQKNWATRTVHYSAVNHTIKPFGYAH